MGQRDIVVGGLWAVFGLGWTAILTAISVSDLSSLIHSTLLLGGVGGIAVSAGALGAIFLAPAPNPPARDRDIRQGICWIVFGRWGLTPVADAGGYLSEVGNAIHEIRQAASEGRVAIWGKLTPHGIHLEVPTGYWVSAAVDILSILNPDDGAVTSTERHGRPDPLYTALQISSAQFEAAWPRKGRSYPQVLDETAA